MKKHKIIAVFSTAAMLMSSMSSVYAKEWEVSTNEEFVKAFKEDTDETVTITLKSDIDCFEGLKANKGQLYIINGQTYVLKEVSLVGEGNVVINGNIAGDNYGISIGESVKAEVNGNIKSKVFGASAYGNSSLKVNGDVDVENAFSAVAGSDNSKIEINGDVTSDTRAVAGGKSTNITINGNIDSTDVGVDTEDEAKIVVEGNITSQNTGVNIQGQSNVEVKGNVSGDNEGVYITGESNLKIEGDVKSKNQGIFATGTSNVEVTGNIESDFVGTISFDESNVEVNGDIKAGICGVAATGTSTITVNGNIDTSNILVDPMGNPVEGAGVLAEEESTVTVNGNVTVTNENDGTVKNGNNGIQVQDNATVTVNGDVTAGDAYGPSTQAGHGIQIDPRAQVSVNGNVYGGVSHDDKGVDGVGIRIALLPLSSDQLGSILVNGIVSGADYGIGVNTKSYNLNLNTITNFLEGQGIDLDEYLSKDVSTITSTDLSEYTTKTMYVRQCFFLKENPQLVILEYACEQLGVTYPGDEVLIGNPNVQSALVEELGIKLSALGSEGMFKFNLGFVEDTQNAVKEILKPSNTVPSITVLQIDSEGNIVHVEGTSESKDELEKEIAQRIRYINTSKENENAEIIFDKDSAKKGEEVTFTVKVKDGYKITSVSNGNVTLTPNADGTYTVVVGDDGLDISIITEKIEDNKGENTENQGGSTNNNQNSQTTTDKTQSSTQTGDDSNIALFGFAGIASLIAMITTKFKKKEQ